MVAAFSGRGTIRVSPSRRRKETFSVFKHDFLTVIDLQTAAAGVIVLDAEVIGKIQFIQRYCIIRQVSVADKLYAGKKIHKRSKNLFLFYRKRL